MIPRKKFPPDWSEVVIGNNKISKFITDGSHFSPKGIEDSNCYMATVENIKFKKFEISSCKKISIEDFKRIERSNCRPEINDVIFSKDGTIGLSFVYDQSDKIVILSSLTMIRLNQNSVISEYLNQFLQSHYLKRQLFFLTSGSALKRVVLRDIKKFKIIIPDIHEQKGISEILSTIDEVIDSTDKLISKYQRIKRGLMYDLFHFGIDNSGILRSEKTHRFKKSKLGNIPLEWNVKKISELLVEVAEPISMKDNEIYRLISIRRRNGGIFERERLRGNKILTKDLHRVIPETFLIANRQIIHGACSYVHEEFADAAVSTAYTSLKARENCDIKWFSWIAKTPLMYKYFLDASQGVVLEKMNFHLKEWFELPIAVPPLPEQSQIVEILNQAEETIEKEEMYKQKLMALKAGLMDDLLSGTVRVNHLIPAES